MTTDNTQAELDEALADLDLRVDSGQAYIFDTTEAIERILDWHNKQIEAVLDRLWQHSEVMNDDVDPRYGVPLSAIEAERNKLKESK